MSTCRAGLTCIPTEAGARRVDPCTPIERSPCYLNRDCGEALHCEDRRCAPAKADGEPCNSYNECYTGHLCVNGARATAVPVAEVTLLGGLLGDAVAARLDLALVGAARGLAVLCAKVAQLAENGLFNAIAADPQEGVRCRSS